MVREHLRRRTTHRLGCGVAQTFFLVDADSCQPVCFTTGTAARTATTAAVQRLDLAADILEPEGALVLVDTEHFTTELWDDVKRRTQFDLLVPMPARQSRRLRAEGINPHIPWLYGFQLDFRFR